MRIIIEFDAEGTEQALLEVPNSRELVALGLEVRFKRSAEALLCFLGISAQEYSHWRAGNRNLPGNAVVRVAAILDIRPERVNMPLEAPGWRRVRPGKKGVRKFTMISERAS
jgi:hypothetical protein